MLKKSIGVVGVVVGVLGFGADSHATTITFDAAFTSPNPAVIDVAPFDFTRNYSNPAGTLVFSTQGFNFGGLGTGGTGGVGSPNSNPELFVLTDATACSSALGSTCNAGDGSDYLLADRFSLITPSGNFGFTSFQGAQLFGPAGCIGCNDDGSDLLNTVSIRVRGFRGGSVLADETFALSGLFQTFTLADPDWANIGRVVFDGLDSAGNPIDGTSLYGIDNINVGAAASPVPEPTSMLLFGTGLVGAGVRRWKKRKA